MFSIYNSLRFVTLHIECSGVCFYFWQQKTVYVRNRIKLKAEASVHENSLSIMSSKPCILYYHLKEKGFISFRDIFYIQ